MNNVLWKLENDLESGKLVRLPCIREINYPLGKYEAVYINHRNLIQECIINSQEQGWEVIAHNGNDYCKAEAEQKLKEFKGEV